jgi:hypothetical protein
MRLGYAMRGGRGFAKPPLAHAQIDDLPRTVIIILHLCAMGRRHFDHTGEVPDLIVGS